MNSYKHPHPQIFSHDGEVTTAVEKTKRVLKKIDENKILNAFLRVHRELSIKYAAEMDAYCENAEAATNKGVPGFQQIKSQQRESQQIESQQIKSQQIESQQIESQQRESNKPSSTSSPSSSLTLGSFNYFLALPIAIKDNIDEAGVVCSNGSRAYAHRVPDRDAVVVRILRSVGAIIIGRTNMHELADGVTSENPHYGPVHNPFRRGYHPGGSSGGSAAAVAAGCVPAALGTDTGGSVRIPAALCGVTGFKPTRGVVSTEGVFPLSTTLDHVGPLGRDVSTTASVFALLSKDWFTEAEELSKNLWSFPFHPPDLSSPQKKRIGVLNGFGIEPERETRECFEKACQLLKELGHTITEVEVPSLSRGISLLAAIYGPEAARIHSKKLQEEPTLFGEEARRNLERGASRPHGKYLHALDSVSELTRDIEVCMEDVDLLVSPTTPFPAQPFGSPKPHLYLSYTCPFNLTGQPAITVPMGFSDDLPVGLQIIGRKNDDMSVLGAASSFEKSFTEKSFTEKSLEEDK